MSKRSASDLFELNYLLWDLYQLLLLDTGFVSLENHPSNPPGTSDRLAPLRELIVDLGQILLCEELPGEDELQDLVGATQSLFHELDSAFASSLFDLTRRSDAIRLWKRRYIRLMRRVEQRSDPSGRG
ncbi:MAG: hypothetical protein AAFU79_02975 [Myxococcota bacterium]